MPGGWRTDLAGLLCRVPVPEPWSEGDKIPWHDPAFSRRMLDEHLSQSHHLASRKFSRIDEHVAWIHEAVLGREPSRILDLGCGPGLYTSRLAALGHECVGIDFSPASIAFAVKVAQRDGLACSYVLADIRHADYGSGYDLVCSIYGEFNAFRPCDARAILAKAFGSLNDAGQVLLEPSTYECTREVGLRPRAWHSVRSSGLFLDRPHLVLTESFWDVDVGVATTRFLIVEADGTVTMYAENLKAYTEAELAGLLAEAGFGRPDVYPSLKGEPDPEQEGMVALVASKSV
jgi:SAM-dependent methyltransferase